MFFVIQNEEGEFFSRYPTREERFTEDTLDMGIYLNEEEAYGRLQENELHTCYIVPVEIKLEKKERALATKQRVLKEKKGDLMKRIENKELVEYMELCRFMEIIMSNDSYGLLIAKEKKKEDAKMMLFEFVDKGQWRLKKEKIEL